MTRIGVGIGIGRRRASGGGASTEALPASAATLVVLGDSIAAGQAATLPADRWANLVAASLGATLTNLGDPGKVLQNRNFLSGSPQASNLFLQYVNAFTGTGQRELAILAAGFNDARYTAAPATMNVANYKTDLTTVVTDTIARGVPRRSLVLVSPYYITDVGLASGSGDPEFNGQSRAGFEAFVTACAEVAAEQNLYYADVYAAMRDGGGASLISGDNIHPNNAGHILIANTVLAATRPVTTSYRFDTQRMWSTASYAFERLRVDYTGNCVELRRSSDNAVQAFGFSGQSLDWAAINAWAGADQKFVRTWYDQSGRGFDLVQTTDANQPELLGNSVSTGRVRGAASIVTMATAATTILDRQNLATTFNVQLYSAAVGNTVGGTFLRHGLSSGNRFWFQTSSAGTRGFEIRVAATGIAASPAQTLASGENIITVTKTSAANLSGFQSYVNGVGPSTFTATAIGNGDDTFGLSTGTATANAAHEWREMHAIPFEWTSTQRTAFEAAQSTAYA